MDELEQISRNLKVSEHILEQNRKLRDEIEQFRILIPLIGTFNAGKSSLLNAFLKRSVLPTDILPETSIATELRYGPEEKIIAFSKTGGEEKFPIDSIRSISSKEYTHIHLYLPHPALKELDHIVLVDMPGLDSNLEEHNQAILAYVKQGVYYLILTESEYGLKESVLSFLQEINSYEMDCSIIVTKADLKLPAEMDSLVQHIRETAAQVTGFPVEVGRVSAKNDEIAEFTEILNGLNQPGIIFEQIEPKAVQAGESVIQDLETRIRYHHFDSSQIDETIHQLNNSLMQLEREIEQESERVSKTFGYQTTQYILDDLQNAIRDQADTLVRAAKAGPEAFKRALNLIVRPAIVNSVDTRVSSVLSDSFYKINRRMDEIGSSLDLVSFDMKEHAGGFEKFVDTIAHPGFRTLIGGMAIVTSIVAPWLELLLFFAPDILKLFINQEKQIRERLEQNIIPEIMEKLHPDVVRVLDEIGREFTEQLQKNVYERKQQILASLERAKEDKIAAEEEDDRYVFALQEGVDQVKAMLERLKKERETFVTVG
jgi:hypothetical protein